MRRALLWSSPGSGISAINHASQLILRIVAPGVIRHLLFISDLRMSDVRRAWDERNGASFSTRILH
jgi:hypothetical protein